MRRVGQIRKRDGNEPDVVKALERIGVIVKRISAPGVPDLLCWHVYTGYFLLEVKGQRGRLTPAQTETAQALPFGVARTVDQAVDYFMSQVKKYA